MSPSQAAGPNDRASRAAIGQAFRAGVESRLGVDLRALAAFRIALGLIILGDLLLLRLPGLRTFYTDDGTLPRAALAEFYPTLEVFSLHALSGSLWWQGLLLAVAAVAAGCLFVGYRTTAATIVSTLLLASLQARNPYVLNGGDTILLSVVLLGIFLPLGARWSIDARRGRPGLGPGPGSGPEPADRSASNRVSSVATATILVHFAAIYAVNGALKYRSDSWMSGTAVQHIFQLEQYVVLLGPYVAEFSALLAAANWGWTALLTASPLLLVFTGRLRLALAAAFVGAQLGLAATMRLGAFPFVMVAVLLLFLPSSVWDRLEGVVEPSVPQRILESADAAPDRSTAVLRRCPFAVRRAGRVAVSVLLIGSLLALLGWQAAGLGVVDATASGVVEEDVEEVNWGFFAPNPPQGYWWYAWEADLESGATVGTLTDESGAIDRPPDAADRYPTTLWQRYGSELRYAPESRYEPLADYYCDRVRPDADSAPETVRVYRLEQPVTADGPTGDLEIHERIEYAC